MRTDIEERSRRITIYQFRRLVDFLHDGRESKLCEVQSSSRVCLTQTLSNESSSVSKFM